MTDELGQYLLTSTSFSSVETMAWPENKAERIGVNRYISHPVRLALVWGLTRGIASELVAQMPTYVTTFSSIYQSLT